MNEKDEDLMCPVCSEYRPEIEHPQPFTDATGRWICGTCWFQHHHLSIMAPRHNQEKATE